MVLNPPDNLSHSPTAAGRDPVGNLSSDVKNSVTRLADHDFPFDRRFKFSCFSFPSSDLVTAGAIHIAPARVELAQGPRLVT